ncbi:MAG: AAA family ATPase [Oscillospiraceae bacterium]|nr:AAA family ATPase [Oscillospiraceae bacterium]
MLQKRNASIPGDFVLFISGVPGVGKTTLSYELLKNYNAFRIIEETDLIREVLRGYNDYLLEEHDEFRVHKSSLPCITDHTHLLSFQEAKEQCRIMTKSFERIVSRQKRKHIPTIINGVHVVPEVLAEIAIDNIAFIDLYVSTEEALFIRLKGREPNSYMLKHIPFIFQTNLELLSSTKKMEHLYPKKFKVIDVSSASISEAIQEIQAFIQLECL